FGATLQLNGDHPAVIAHLFLRQLETRMVGQSGIEYLRDTTHLLKGIRQPPSICTMAVHSYSESLQTTQNEVAIHRPGDSTGRVLQEANFFEHVLLRSHYGAANHIGVAPQILRGAMHDEVGAQSQRLLQIRRRKRIIHDNHYLAALGELTQS